MGAIVALKAEFESEGSSKEDVQFLKSLFPSIPLYLKIGGVEAVRDIHDAIDLGVNTIIAPMVETSFAVKKFLGAIEKVDNKFEKKSIVIESITSLNNIDSIIKNSRKFIQNITLGRTDFSRSFEKDTNVEDPKIYDAIFSVSQKAVSNQFTFTLGGSISSSTLENNLLHKSIKNINFIETRNVIFNAQNLFENHDLLVDAIRFEETYILLLKQRVERRYLDRIDRISNLERRLNNCL